MGKDVKCFRAEGIIPQDVREILQGGGARDTPVCRLIASDVPSDWEDPGRVSPQGGPSAGKGSAKEGHDKQVYLSATGSENEGSGTGGGGDIIPLPPEYRFPVYHHLADTGAMSGGGATPGGACVDEMMGSGWTGPRAWRDGDGDIGGGGGGGKGKLRGEGSLGEEVTGRVRDNMDGN